MGNENGSLEGLPNKTKHCGQIEVKEGYTIGYCSMQGWRRTMEDAILISKNINEKVSGLYGVFDGHGGSIVSQFVATNLKKVITNINSFTKGEYEKAIAQSFLKFDKLLDNKEINDFLSESNSEIVDNSNENNSNKSDESSIILESNRKYKKLDLDKFNEITNLKEKNKVKIFVEKDRIKRLNKKSSSEKYIIEQLNSSNSENEDNIDNVYDNDIDNQVQTTTDNKNEKNIENGQSSPDYISEKLFYDNFVFDKEISIDEEEPDNKNNHNEDNDNKDKNNGNKESNYKIAYEMGTTANLILLEKNERTNFFTVYIANTGDSISYMFKKGQAIKLTKEHKVIRQIEKERINNINKDIIINERVGGKLNLSRAIGDLHFKDYVISLPEITKIDSTEDIDFIIIGCDGFWDSVDPQIVCNRIQKELKDDKKADTADCSKTNKEDNNKNKIDEILSRLFEEMVPESNSGHIGTDNISVIILLFKNEKNTPQNKLNIEGVEIRNEVVLQESN